MKFWKIKLALCLNYFVFAILLNSVGTVILEVQRHYGVAAPAAAILEACKDLSIAVTSFFVASLLTRFGYKRAMLVALGFIAGVCLLVPAFPGFTMTKLLFVATGVSFALIKVSVFATIGLITNGQREHAGFMSFIESVFMVGILSGYFLFGAFTDEISGGAGWLQVYYVLAGLAGVAFFLLLATPLDETSVHVEERVRLSTSLASTLRLLAVPLVLVFGLSVFTYVLIEQSIMSWLPTYNNHVLHLPPTLSIQMASLLAGASALGRFLASFLLRRFAWFGVLAGCLVAAAALVLSALPLATHAGAGVVTGWSDAPLAAFVFPLIGLFIAPIYPAINSTILSSLPARQHGPMAGLIVILSALGGTTGSLVTGRIFGAYGGQVAFYLSLVPIAALLVWLACFRRLQSRSTPLGGDRAGMNSGDEGARKVEKRPLAARDSVYGPLFAAVQRSGLFPDSKSFVDCIPRREPALIAADYLAARAADATGFDLGNFVFGNFVVPSNIGVEVPAGQTLEQHIATLWRTLRHEPDHPERNSSLIPLPHPYIVPGGRFREVYYWDSYFTMLGLREAGEERLIESMVENFAWLIGCYGFIPNANRTYYLSRSQPPCFSLMVDLLADCQGSVVYQRYRVAMQAEHDFWMDQVRPTWHAVTLTDGAVLNRYYDQLDTPRPEAFIEDEAIARQSGREPAQVYRDLRAAAESGWDFSSRWFADGSTLETIHTTDLLPIDLNSLLCHLERSLARTCAAGGDDLLARRYAKAAEDRAQAITRYAWSEAAGFFCDYDFVTRQASPQLSLAGLMPLFLRIATDHQATAVAKLVRERFLRSGGVVTTLRDTGQQWDEPNGWAPLQWITIRGLIHYGHHDLAAEITRRWLTLNRDVYGRVGKLMEKYNVVDVRLRAGGGEYPAQDGFGWTNGVLLGLLAR